MTSVAKEFWASPAAERFPYSLEIHGTQWPVTEQADYYGKTFKHLLKKGWIPQIGEILELGAGASSGLLFPAEVVGKRLTATDISERLLARNSVPKEQKYILDAGSDTYPAKWDHHFTLVMAMHLSRYLDISEKVHMAHQAHRVLSREGRILLIDTTQTPNRDVAQIIGEESAFSPEQESAILAGTGFSDIEYGSYFLTFFDRFGERRGTLIDYATATVAS